MQFPANYSPDFVDAERLCIALLQPAMDQCDPGGTVATWLPDDHDAQLTAGKAIVMVHRIGGGNSERGSDFPTVQVGVLATSRETAWQVMGYLRQTLSQAKGTTVTVTGHPWAIGSVDEITGPIQVPKLELDSRFVTAVFQIATRQNRR